MHKKHEKDEMPMHSKKMHEKKEHHSKDKKHHAVKTKVAPHKSKSK